RRRHRGLAVLGALVGVAALAGGGVAAVVGHNSPRGSSATSGAASLSQQGIGGATQPGAGNSPSALPTSNGPLSPSAIAAQVDPAIVDVTSTLADQGATAAGTGMIIT